MIKTVKNTFNAREVAMILDVSQPTASRYITRMNRELESEGFYTVRGKIPVEYFKEKFPHHRSDEIIRKMEEST